MEESVTTKNLLDLFKLVKRPTHVLGTSYSLSLAFFESVVLSKIDRSHLRKCLIITDKLGYNRAMTEAPALRYVTSTYSVCTAPTKHSFHPKLWLIANSEQALLIVGSGNLTQSGFSNNREIFDCFDLAAYGGKSKLVKDLMRFLKKLGDLFPKDPGEQPIVHETIDDLRDLLKKLKKTETSQVEEPLFLSSFDGSFLKRLGNEISDVEELNVASPFFGGKLNGLQQLAEATKAQRVRVFPAIHKDGSVDLPLPDLNAIPSFDARELATEDTRYRHAKFYGFHTGQGSWFLSGSMNCTEAALTSKNVEVGILRKLPKEEVTSYFASTENTLNYPQRMESYEGQDQSRLTLWANTSGNSIKLTVSQGASNLLPLENVKVTLSGALEQETNTLPRLFSKGHAESLNWSDFKEIKRQQGVPYILELQGQTAQGRLCQGACFIDDILTLTSSPEQRGALRAVQALMGEESGLPDPIDVNNALKYLSLDVLTKAPRRAAKPKGKEEEDEDRVALWPPVTVARTSGLLSGHSRNVFWFQQMLSSLLKAKDKDASVADSEIEEEGTETPTEVDERVVKRCKTFWEKVEEGFENFEKRLWSLTLDESSAGRVIPASVALILATLACRSQVDKVAQGVCEVPPSDQLLYRFLQTLFQDRRQSKRRAIITDLDRFKEVRVHSDLGAIVLASFIYIDLTNRDTNSSAFPLYWFLRLKRASSKEEFEEMTRLDNLERIIKQHFVEAEATIDRSMIERSLQGMLSQTWKDLPQFKELVDLIEERPSRRKRLVRIESFASETPWNCDMPGMISARMNALGYLQPVKCEHCSNVLVPEELYDAFVREEADRGSAK